VTVRLSQPVYSREKIKIADPRIKNNTFFGITYCTGIKKYLISFTIDRGLLLQRSLRSKALTKG
jgi:hypothetical protein